MLAFKQSFSSYKLCCSLIYIFSNNSAPFVSYFFPILLSLDISWTFFVLQCHKTFLFVTDTMDKISQSVSISTVCQLQTKLGFQLNVRCPTRVGSILTCKILDQVQKHTSETLQLIMSEWATVSCPTRVGSVLTSNYQTRLKMPSCDKHSSLFFCSCNREGTSFISLTPGACFIKLFTTVIYAVPIRDSTLMVSTQILEYAVRD